MTEIQVSNIDIYILVQDLEIIIIMAMVLVTEISNIFSFLFSLNSVNTIKKLGNEN